MAIMNPSFDPGRVLMGPGAGKGPYINPGASGAGGGPSSVDYSTLPKITPIDKPPVLGAESVRATGKGPFDAAYRQNLATYAGGQFQRPGGSMSFNPTDASTFPGQPTGYGSAPLPGLPGTLVGSALGGNPFSWAPPPSPAVPNADTGQPDLPDWKFWLKQYRNQGGGYQPFMQ